MLVSRPSFDRFAIVSCHLRRNVYGRGANWYQLHPKWSGGRRRLLARLGDEAEAPIFRLLARLVGWGRGGGGARAEDAAGAPLDAAAAAWRFPEAVFV